MGIEKVVPSFRDLEVMLQLLPRSSTGERMNPYTSIWTGVHAGDGPRAFHLVLLDAGRTRALADEVGRDALRCIRCSACINVCPVYRQTGGHAYHTPYAGPIGAILQPQLDGRARRLVVAPVRLDALRRLRGRLPGADRHPRGCSCTSARRSSPRSGWAPRGGPEAARPRLSLARRLRAGAAAGARLQRPFVRDGWIRRFPPGPLRGLGRAAAISRRCRADVPRVVGVP